MKYSKDFFDIQVKFVEHLASVDNKDFLDYLPFYSEMNYRFNIPSKDFHPNNEVWLEFINNCYDAQNKTDSFYSYILEREKSKTKEVFEHRFGYFRYEIEIPTKTVRIHTVVEPVDDSIPSALSKQNLESTLNDLAQMFIDIKNRYSKEITHVRGNSWLYNIESYRRLFPESFYSNPDVKKVTFGGLALWGQFLDKSLNVKETIKDDFLTKLKDSTDFIGAMNCFEFQCLSVKGPIEDFYTKYNI